MISSTSNRYACLALGQLAVERNNHKGIIVAGGIEALSASLHCDDGETTFNACYALSKLAANDANLEASRLKDGDTDERVTTLRCEVSEIVVVVAAIFCTLSEQMVRTQSKYTTRVALW